MEQMIAYEAQIDSLIASECFQKLPLAEAKTAYFLQKGRGAGIVLKSDMRTELGGARPSFSMLLPSDIKDSSIFLCGEDLDTEEQSLPFGQIVKVSGADFDEEMYYQLGQLLHGIMQADGYMVKKTGPTLLCRISKQVAADGLSFAVLGEILIQRIKERFAKVEHVQVFYITSPLVKFESWQFIAEKIAQAQKKVKEVVWQNRGINVNECLKMGHCGECTSKVICDKAREIGKEVVSKMKLA